MSASEPFDGTRDLGGDIFTISEILRVKHCQVPPTNLPHADGPADTQRRLGRYAVQGTETFHRRVVLQGDRT